MYSWGIQLNQTNKNCFSTHNPTHKKVIKLSTIKSNPNNKCPMSVEIVTDAMIVIGKAKNGKNKYRFCKCNSCNKWYEKKKYCKNNPPKFCSNECYAESQRLHKKCKLCNEEIINKHSVSMKNRIYCSRECQGKARQGVELSEEWKKSLSEGRKNSINCKGENLYNWKGGVVNQRRLNLKRHYSKKAAGKIDFNYLDRLLLKQENKCFYCNLELLKYKAIEHLTPICKGGTNDWFNLVFSCRSCNSKKNSKTLFEFALSENKIHILNKTEQFEAKFNF